VRARSGLEIVPNILPLQGFDARTVQPVASRYTDGAISVHNSPYNTWNSKGDEPFRAGIIFLILARPVNKM